MRKTIAEKGWRGVGEGRGDFAAILRKVGAANIRPRSRGVEPSVRVKGLIPVNDRDEAWGTALWEI
jgi:hypothetical protein